MFVDIHTHQQLSRADFSIYNLPLLNAESLLNLPNRYFSAGVHPWDSTEEWEKAFAKLEQLAVLPMLVAIGECGFDKNARTNFEIQLEIFEQQIALSEKVQKPLIIHCVGYYNELLQLKKRVQPHQLWIIHGFRGKPQLAQQVLNADCAISYGEHFNAESVQLTPIERLFVESDESKLSIRQLYSNIAAAKQCQPSELTAGKRFIEQLTRSTI